MTNEEAKLTFIGKSYASQGFQFFFQGPNPKCPKNCNLYATCQENLQPEVVYEVVEVLKRKLECPKNFHEEEMILCKLKIPTIIISMENKDIYLGSIINFHPVECEREKCPHYQYCQPSKLLLNKEKIKIIKKLKKIEGCSKKKHISLVQIEKSSI